MLNLTLSCYSHPNCSDNGAWTHEKLDGGSNGLLRGEKGETWEGGLRYNISAFEGKNSNIIVIFGRL